MAGRERYYIPVNGTLVEVEEAVYRAYYKMERRERYLEERDKENGVLSYNALDGGGTVGEEILEDTSDSMENLVLAKELSEHLHRCIDMLPKAERELIEALYFDGLTEKAYASRVQMSQSAVSRKQKKILSKMKMLWNLLERFD